MPVYTMTRYPQTVELRDNATLTIRPMAADDAPALLSFFLGIPEEERFLLKDDVTSPKVIEGWAAHLDYDRALPLLAVADGRVVGNAVLIRHRGGSRAHTAEIRVVIAPDYRGRGLGVAMMRELVEIAADADLEKVIFEMVADVQDEAIAAAKYLGAFPIGSVDTLAKDSHGREHDVVYLALPLGRYWDWSRF